MNTFGDLRGTFAAVERINSVLSEIEIDEALAYGVEREMQQKELHGDNYKLFYINDYDERILSRNVHYMSALKSASNVCSLAWSGDVCLEGINHAVLFILFTLSILYTRLSIILLRSPSPFY